MPSRILLDLGYRHDSILHPVPCRIILVAGLRHDYVVLRVSFRFVLDSWLRHDLVVHRVPCRHVLYCWRRGLYVELMQRRVRRRLLLGKWRLFAVRCNHNGSGAVHALQCRHIRNAVIGELFRVCGRVLLPLRHGHDRSLHSVSAGVLFPLRHRHVLVVHRVPGRNVLHYGRRWLSVERLRRCMRGGLLFHPRRLCRCRRHERSGAVHALRCGHVRDPVVRELLGVPDRYVLESGYGHKLGLHGLPSRNVLHYRCRGLRIERLRRPMH